MSNVPRASRFLELYFLGLLERRGRPPYLAPLVDYGSKVRLLAFVGPSYIPSAAIYLTAPLFSDRNKYLNDNKCARIFGNIGFGWFDKERKAFMGTALALTVVAIVITGFGCFALSDDDSIIFYTTWGISYMKYTNADGVKVGQVKPGNVGLKVPIGQFNGAICLLALRCRSLTSGFASFCATSAWTRARGATGGNGPTARKITVNCSTFCFCLDKIQILFNAV